MNTDVKDEAMMLYKKLHIIPAICPFSVFELAVSFGYRLAVTHLTNQLRSVVVELKEKQKLSQ